MSGGSLPGEGPASLPAGLAVFRRLLAWIGRAELMAAIAALVAVVLLSATQAFLRYFVGASLWWAQEIAETLILVCYFFGISYVFKTRQEIVIEFLSAMAPLRLQVLLFVLEQLFVLAFVITVVWLTHRFSPTMFNMQTPVLKLPAAVTFAPLVVASLMMALTALYYLGFGLWALRNGGPATTLAEIEARGLILRPWLDEA